MAVFQDLAPGDTLLIGGRTRIRLERKTGGRARLRIESDQDIDVAKAGDPLPALDRPAIKPAPPGPPETPQPFLRRP